METAITYERLFLNIGQAIVRAYDMTIQESSNQHGRISIIAILDRTFYDAVLESNPVFLVAFYIDDQEEKKPLFTGIITDITTAVQGDQYLMQVSANASTYAMDMGNRSRAFQDPARTNHQLLTQIVTGGQYGFIRSTIEEKPVEDFWLQYEETDWAFLKRVASAYGVRIFPVNQDSVVVLRLGLPEETTEVEWDDLSYKISQDLASYHYLEDNELDGEKRWNCLRYTVVTYDVLQLGDKVIFRGREMYIGKVVRTLNQGIVVNQYTLYFPEGLWVPQFYNDNLKGISIMGTVVSVQRNQVQVQLAVDAADAQEGKRWFAYSTMAASPDGSGWYAMPKSGESVRLFFPEAKEQSAYTITCLAANAGGDKTVITDWGTQALCGPDGAEIAFTEDGVVMKSSQGQIVLTNSGDVRIQNSKRIVLEAGEEIQIKAEGAVEIKAPNRVALESPFGKVAVVEGMIEMIGTKEVHFNVAD